MTKRAARAVGTILKIGDNAISDLSSIPFPSATLEEIDVTTLDSSGGVREFIPGFEDPGSLTVNGKYVPSDVGQDAVYDAFKSKEIQTFTIIYPARIGKSFSFDGFISAFNITAETENAVEFEATIRVSGEITDASIVSTGLSALSLTGTGGTLAPTFANGTHGYIFDGVTASSVTVTATAASHTIRLYIDGAFSQELTTAVASSAIALTTDVVKRLTIVAFEDSKAPVAYEVSVLKVS